MSLLGDMWESMSEGGREVLAEHISPKVHAEEASANPETHTPVITGEDADGTPVMHTSATQSWKHPGVWVGAACMAVMVFSLLVRR
ncbi:hypothetical protein [Algicola sagamiensis]|uniref:hypothetical protein n=1 Tax=Algicola sagamiensis TaxID=163869 RepID=UPI000366461E|nr:hypothetical protein [Algicola sagamiensis]